MVHWLALLLKQLQKFIWHTIKIWKSWQPEYSHELLLSRHPTMIQSFHGYEQVAELSLALAFVAQVFCLLPLKHSGTQQSGFLDLIQLMLSLCLNTSYEHHLRYSDSHSTSSETHELPQVFQTFLLCLYESENIIKLLPLKFCFTVTKHLISNRSAHFLPSSAKVPFVGLLLSSSLWGSVLQRLRVKISHFVPRLRIKQNVALCTDKLCSSQM